MKSFLYARMWAKNSKKLVTLLAALLLIGMSGCGDDDESGTSNNNTNDKCAEVTCDPIEASCDGTVALSAADGVCLPESGECSYTDSQTSVDCADTDQICQDGACVDEGTDLCEGEICDAPEASCVGTIAVTYTGAGVCDSTDGSCDFTAVEERTECADSDQICQNGACVDEGTDLCEDVTCDDPPAATCDDDTAINYTRNGVCVEADGSCDYSGAETRIDCTATSQICLDGACVDEDTDLCDGVTCNDPPPASCDGDIAVNYTRNGVCVEADGSCDYSGVETRIDCAATSQTCENGVCADGGDDHSVNAGDLVITEIMANPAVVNDADGEYFEVFNTTNRTLYISDLEISDDGSDSFTVASPNDAPVMVGPNEYFVFGRNADSSTNGGIQVDYEWSSMALANGDDSIFIVRPGQISAPDIIVDSVIYDTSTGFPSVPTGASLQFGGQHDATQDDNGDGTLWCESTLAIDSTVSADDSDKGTPGAQNSVCSSVN